MRRFRPNDVLRRANRPPRRPATFHVWAPAWRTALTSLALLVATAACSPQRTDSTVDASRDAASHGDATGTDGGRVAQPDATPTDGESAPAPSKLVTCLTLPDPAYLCSPYGSLGCNKYGRIRVGNEGIAIGDDNETVCRESTCWPGQPNGYLFKGCDDPNPVPLPAWGEVTRAGVYQHGRHSSASRLGAAALFLARFDGRIAAVRDTGSFASGTFVDVLAVAYGTDEVVWSERALECSGELLEGEYSDGPICPAPYENTVVYRVASMPLGVTADEREPTILAETRAPAENVAYPWQDPKTETNLPTRWLHMDEEHVYGQTSDAQIVRLSLATLADPKPVLEPVRDVSSRVDESGYGVLLHYTAAAVYVFSSAGLERVDKTDLSVRTLTTENIRAVEVVGNTVYMLREPDYALLRVADSGGDVELYFQFRYPSLNFYDGFHYYVEGSHATSARDWAARGLRLDP